MHGKHVDLIPFFWFELFIKIVDDMVCYPCIWKSKREVKSLCHSKATEIIANVRKAYVCNPFKYSVIDFWSSQQGASREISNLQLAPTASFKILYEFLADFGLSGWNGKVITEFQFYCSPNDRRHQCSDKDQTDEDSFKFHMDSPPIQN